MTCTYDDYLASREHANDIGAALAEETLAGIPGYIYFGSFWIAEEPDGIYRTLIGREEYKGDHECIERTLWDRFVREEMASSM